jgi:hypothetical protein
MQLYDFDIFNTYFIQSDKFLYYDSKNYPQTY